MSDAKQRESFVCVALFLCLIFHRGGNKVIDVVIIGGGICGASIARELSKYNVEVVVVEKKNDIAAGTTKANSGIVHAGYDPVPGTLMAKYNVWGNRLIEVLCKDLEVPYKKVGSLVLAFTEEEMEHLDGLYKRGVENKVPDLCILTKEEWLARDRKSVL